MTNKNFGTKLYRQIVGIPVGKNCAPLVADLFLYAYERDFMDSLNHDNQADVIEAFTSATRYLDDLLNIDNPYYEGMVNQIYPSELQLNKANTTETEARFLDVHLSIAKSPDIKLFILVSWGRSFMSVAWPTGVQLVLSYSKLFGAQGSPSSGSLLNLLSSRF